MSDEELYDEFGNLIGDPLDSDAESVDEVMSGDETSEINDDVQKADHNAIEVYNEPENGNALEKTYGNDVITIIPNNGIPSKEEPVIIPEKIKKLKVEFVSQEVDKDEEDKLPQCNYSRSYLLDLMSLLPERIRNVAIIGDLHSGKTSLVDMLVLQTHSQSLGALSSVIKGKPLKFTDNHKIEIDRGMTIKSSPITLLLSDLLEKSYAVNIIDTPGHINFFDEVAASLKAVDGAILVLDAIEGLTSRSKGLIDMVINENIPLTVTINKIDRLIVELKLPPADFYYKVNYIIDDLNAYFKNHPFLNSYSHHVQFSPSLNNIMFASTSLKFCFNLNFFSNLYYKNSCLELVDFNEFSKRLWGDVYYNSEANTFTVDSNHGKFPKTFTKLILEPIYKIVTYTLTSDSSEKKLAALLWHNFGVTLHKSDYSQDTTLLLKRVFEKVFKGNSGFIDMVTSTISDPITSINFKFNLRDDYGNELIANVVKLIESSDASKFYSLVRIYLGTMKVGDRIKILGENFQEDSDDYKYEVIDEMFLAGGRYKVPVKSSGPGTLVVVGGIDATISKYAWIFDGNIYEITKQKNTLYDADSVFKIAIEPEIPSELPKLLEAMRKVNKSYLASVVKVEESGDHVILAPGELYLDCILHDLRNFFADDLEIKVSDPMTKFSETCVDLSSTKIPSKNNSNTISIIAEPLSDDKLSHAIENGMLKLSDPIKTTSRILRKEFGWDSLASRSIWSFGPDDLKFPNILLDDTLEGETDKKLLYSVKDSIDLGFKWAVNEGPLCEEPIRNTKFKILDAVLSGSEIQRSVTHLVPLTRRACYTGFLTATPRLMEPIYGVSVTCTSIAIRAISKLLEKRRGHVTNENAIPGSPLYTVEGYVPVIESVGLESDIRLQTQGQAMCFLSFDYWDIVPGDPLDKDCYLPSLTPVPHDSLARDFVLKTRKQKGLSGEPGLQKYIDGELFQKLVENGIIQS